MHHFKATNIVLLTILKFNNVKLKAVAFFCFTLYIFTSCIPQKDLIYFQETQNQLPITVHESQKKPYRLAIDDVLSVSIKTADQEISKLFEITDSGNNNGNVMFAENMLYFNGFKVDVDGNIVIPVLEKINVLNKTVDEVRDLITKRLLQDYLTNDAQVFVNVKIAGIRYTINGEIGKPGVNIIYNDKATLMDAIAQSGDITMVGNRKEVMIYRQFPHGVESAILDLTKMEVMNSSFFYIQPNDLIYIKPLKQKSFGTGTTGLQTLTTLVSAFSLIFTTILLIRK